MEKITIKLSTIADVKTFVNAVAKYEYEVDLISGRYSIDAKSIMGIFSLDISKEIELNAHTDDASDLKNDIKMFIV